MTILHKYNKEINNYLDQPTVASDYNPLQWWKEHNCVLPLLAKMAKKYLCVPGMSVPSKEFLVRVESLLILFVAGYRLAM